MTTPMPMQGLAAYLRCEAGGVFVGHPSHDALMQWAKEVETATEQGKRQPLSDERLWELRAEAKADPRTADQHWFILFARAIETTPQGKI